MQYTDKYQFKLIEGSDPFLPNALNDNAQKLETALDQHEAAVNAALALRPGMITGSYVGTGDTSEEFTMSIELEGKPERPPRLILVCNEAGTHRIIMLRGMAKVRVGSSADTEIRLTWTDRGVRWNHIKAVYSDTNLNYKDETYYYAVFI